MNRSKGPGSKHWEKLKQSGAIGGVGSAQLRVGDFDHHIGDQIKYLVHNNYISGVDSKIKRFKDHGMWHLDKEDFNKVIRRKLTC